MKAMPLQNSFYPLPRGRGLLALHGIHKVAEIVGDIISFAIGLG